MNAILLALALTSPIAKPQHGDATALQILAHTIPSQDPHQWKITDVWVACEKACETHVTARYLGANPPVAEYVVIDIFPNGHWNVVILSK